MEKKQTFIDSSNILKTLRFLSRIPCASLHVPIYAAGAPFFPCKANVWADAQNNIQNKPNQTKKKKKRWRTSATSAQAAYSARTTEE